MKLKAPLFYLLMSLSALSNAQDGGSVTVNWTVPALKTDGSAQPIGEIVGYRIFHGSTIALDNTVDVPGGTTTTRTITGLPAGTHYFALTARTATEESDLTTVVSKIILVQVPPPVAKVIAISAGVPYSPVYSYTVDAAGKASRSSTFWGLAPVGADCTGPVLFSYRSKPYRQIVPANVRFESPTTNTKLAVACQ